ncbi:MAG: CatB-related O-acetyltransferase [Okeania sp. SIO2G4]|nr:CatB-related O-acetyltransferase [Okeania sp. SIO2G5]NEP96242.1 CatB-related O-acetyltransferase [Okeania sp. SIO2F5]NEQ93984.1 CatB-related O-acetyltransferase [Okeania sp. SIO2G4]
MCNSNLNCRLTGSLFFESNVNVVNSEFISSKYRGAFIGRYSYINPGGIIRDCFIGRYCSIGRRVSIAAGQHPYHYLSTHPFSSSCLSPKSSITKKELEKSVLPEGKNIKATVPLTTIMHDVWIGDGAVIVKGVKIGVGAVVGANAVVTKDVPPYAIVAGVPSKILGFRFRNHIINELLASEWWNLNHEIIVNNIPAKNIIESLEKLKELIQKNNSGQEKEDIFLFTN